jgi:hypothetical protein
VAAIVGSIAATGSSVRMSQITKSTLFAITPFNACRRAAGLAPTVGFASSASRT